MYIYGSFFLQAGSDLVIRAITVWSEFRTSLNSSSTVLFSTFQVALVLMKRQLATCSEPYKMACCSDMPLGSHVKILLRAALLDL